jgi:hypothetical protein
LHRRWGLAAVDGEGVGSERTVRVERTVRAAGREVAGRRRVKDNNAIVAWAMDASITSGHSHANCRSIPALIARALSASKDRTNAHTARASVMSSVHQ